MKRNPWPYAIIAYFVVFIAGMAAWVAFAMRHDDQLVRPDYYEHEIAYQKQIDRVARTSGLQSEVEIAYDPAHQSILIGLPGTNSIAEVRGRIQMYRPSDARLDRDLALALDSHRSQVVDVSALPSGLWKVLLTWTSQDRDYYFEKRLVLSAE